MRNIIFAFTLLFTFIGSTTSFAQDKIQIALVGTTHFEPSQTDLYKNAALSIFSERRQSEIQEIVNQFKKFAPDQICVEWYASAQNKLLAEYQNYLSGAFKLTANETHQLGFKTAQALDQKKIYGIAHKGSFDFDKVAEFAQKENQMELLMGFQEHAEAMIAAMNKKQAAMSISDFLQHINTSDGLRSNAEMYTKYIAVIGSPDQPVGTNLVADWYATNLNIYTNILRNISAEDQRILVIIGQGHVSILRDLFESNSDFEVIPLASILN